MTRICALFVLVLGCSSPAPQEVAPEPPAPEPTAEETPAAAPSPVAEEAPPADPSPTEAPVAEPPPEAAPAKAAATKAASAGCPGLAPPLSELQAATDLDVVARKHGLAIVEGRVRVVIEPEGELAPLQGPITEEVRGTAGVQALVPPKSLCALARRADVAAVRAPRRPSAKPGVRPRPVITTNKPKKPTSN